MIRDARGRRPVAFTAASGFIVILLVVQMWLLTAALESSLAGHDEVTLPAFIASVLLSAASGAIYLFTRRRDRAGLSRDRTSTQGPWLIG